MKCNSCKYLEDFYEDGCSSKYCTMRPELTINCEFYEPRRKKERNR